MTSISAPVPEPGGDETDLGWGTPPEPPGPQPGGDETDVGWGTPPEPADSDLERLTRERPPHHDDGW